MPCVDLFFFFFKGPATPRIHPPSPPRPPPNPPVPAPTELDVRPPHPEHDANGIEEPRQQCPSSHRSEPLGDRKSTRLNSSHSQISYAVFCLKKKKTASARHSPPSTAWSGTHQS